MKNPYADMLMEAPRDGGFRMDGYYVWCGSVVRAVEDGKYHMFASRWPQKYGFGHNWLYRSEVVRAVSDTPVGPFAYAETVLPARDPSYFDGRNTHNPMIRCHDGTYYLYYMGTTFEHDVPTGDALCDGALAERTWNRKRIGLATAPSIYGPWTRRDVPLLEPREGCWDSTVTTNPAVAILPDGTTYMLYKSRAYTGGKLQIGVAKAPRPDGPFERLSDEPIFRFPHPDFHVEDPYLWYEDGRFHLIIKDDFKNGCGGVTGVWGSGFYAESEDCIHWEIADDPIVYTRRIRFEGGEEQDMPNAERPFLLTEEDGKPVCLYLATGKGDAPYALESSWSQAIPCRRDQ